MRRATALAVLCASAAGCLAEKYEIVDSFGDAGESGESNQPMGGSGGTGSGGRGGSTGTGGRGGSAGSVSPPTGGDGGEDPGTGGATAGGTSSTGGDGSGGSAGDAGSATGGNAGTTGGSSSGAGSGGSGSGGKGGSAGSGAGRGGAGSGGSSAGTGGSSAGTGGSSAGTGGGGRSGTVLFQDDFESGVDGWTPIPSANWTTASDGTTVYAVTGAMPNSTARTASAGDLAWTDVAVEARLKITGITGSSSAYYAGICARYQSATSHVCLALRSNGQVAFRVSGTNTNAWTPSPAIVENAWYTVRVVAIGASVTGYLNGMEVPASTRVTSGAPTSGAIALTAPAMNAVFDDVRVTVP